MLRKTKSRSLLGKHLKTTLLAFILLFSVNTLMAQQKYDYAVITYGPSSRTLAISIDTEFKEVEVSKSDVKHTYDLGPVLKEINRMNDEGWELFNTGTIGGVIVYVFYLRRKEQ